MPILQDIFLPAWSATYRWLTRRHRAVSTQRVGFPHSSTGRGYLKIVKELLAYNRLNYLSPWTNRSMTYCETDHDEPVPIIFTDAAITGNINSQTLEK